jgi:hypothetical protein
MTVTAYIEREEGTERFVLREECGDGKPVPGRWIACERPREPQP